ncbi:MAG: hypothetical protein V4773_01640 [Verrucomicrobiota bacterium]
MKRIAIALIATAAAALAANTAHAGTDVRIGVNIGGPSYRPAPPVVVARPPTVVYAPPVVVAPSRGYWKDVTVKTWVPERWVVRHNRWGRSERVCEPGYYTYTTNRVWVDGRNDRFDHDRHDHDRRNDGRGYGFDNDNRGGWRR